MRRDRAVELAILYNIVIIIAVAVGFIFTRSAWVFLFLLLISSIKYRKTE